MSVDARERTIQDFGEQWSRYRDNEGFYGSADLFADIVKPLLDPSEFLDARVADVGSGTGRIVRMLLAAGAAHVTAIEPSRAAFDVLSASLQSEQNRVTLLNLPGEKLPPRGDLDFVVSIGVLHHVPQPDPIVSAALHALRPGGRLVVWLYGREGNGLYLSVAEPARWVCRRLPHAALVAVVWALYLPLLIYLQLTRILPLPLGAYFRNVLARMDGRKRRLVIYDQLNPAFAKYYRREEAVALLAGNGFRDVMIHHRHGYSWTVVGTR
jgi:SAM-dependent methyltransferase